jgi:hypothetical protein
VVIWLNSFLILALDGGDVVSNPAQLFYLPPKENAHWYPLRKGLIGPQNHLDILGAEKIVPLLEFKPRILQPVG